MVRFHGPDYIDLFAAWERVSDFPYPDAGWAH